MVSSHRPPRFRRLVSTPQGRASRDSRSAGGFLRGRSPPHIRPGCCPACRQIRRRFPRLQAPASSTARVIDRSDVPFLANPAAQRNALPWTDRSVPCSGGKARLSLSSSRPHAPGTPESRANQGAERMRRGAGQCRCAGGSRYGGDRRSQQHCEVPG